MGAVEGGGVGLEDAAHPVGVVSELLDRFHGEGDRGVGGLVLHAVPVGEDGLEEGHVALVAEAGELGASHAAKNGVEGAGGERSTVGGFFDVDRPLEGLDRLADECHRFAWGLTKTV